MSVRAISEVWNREVPGPLMLTALALADHADHDGRNTYPSVGLLAWKTGQSRRTVQRHLRALEASGFIEPAGYPNGGHGRATRYHFNFEKVGLKPPHRRPDGPDSETGRAPE